MISNEPYQEQEEKSKGQASDLENRVKTAIDKSKKLINRFKADRW